MANLNGIEVDLLSLSLERLAETILRFSPTGDGRGVELTLAKNEYEIIAAVQGELNIGLVIMGFVQNLIEDRTGTRPEMLEHSFDIIAMKLVVPTDA